MAVGTQMGCRDRDIPRCYIYGPGHRRPIPCHCSLPKRKYHRLCDSQKTEKHILCKPHDQRLAGNLAAKKAMAAELAGMGLNREAIARLLNLHRQKED
jgi:hypothetical protein